MEPPIGIDTMQAILLFALIGAAAGFRFGLVPLIYGKMKGKFRLGLTVFIVSIVAGAIWIILPLFVMITFVFLIIRDTKQPTAAPEVDSPTVDIDEVQ